MDHNAPCLSPKILHTSTKLDVIKVLLRPPASFRDEVYMQRRLPVIGMFLKIEPIKLIQNISGGILFPTLNLRQIV